MFFKNNKKENFLEFIPISRIEYKQNEDNETISLLIPRFRSEFMQKYFIPKDKSKYINANLDKFGSFAFTQIDGKTTLLQICEKMKEHFGEEVEPVYERVSKFFGHLYRYSLIDFVKKL